MDVLCEKNSTYREEGKKRQRKNKQEPVLMQVSILTSMATLTHTSVNSPARHTHTRAQENEDEEANSERAREYYTTKTSKIYNMKSRNFNELLVFMCSACAPGFNEFKINW